MSIMTRSLEGFSLPFMKQMASVNSLSEYKASIRAWESRLRAIYKDQAALARFFGGSTKRTPTMHPLHAEMLPNNTGNLTAQQLKRLALGDDTLSQQARYAYTELCDRVAVLQHEWVRSALYMLYKHQANFLMEGGYEAIQKDVALRATNRSGERIYLPLSTDFYWTTPI
jgi:hypothetical protein